VHEPALIAEQYDVANEYALAEQLAFFGDALGEDRRSAAWAEKALELARSASNQAVVVDLSRRFAVDLLLSGRYAEVMETVLEHGAILRARALEREAGRDSFRPQLDVGAILGDRPNDNWRASERWAVLGGLLPAAVRVCMVALDSPEAAGSAAEEVAAVCRQIGAEADDPELWGTMAELFERAFVGPVSAKELKQMAEACDTSLSAVPRVIGLLLASMQPELAAEDAAIIHLSVLPGLCQFLDWPFAAHRRMLVPFVRSYWRRMFERMRFRFHCPNLVERALAEADAAPVKEQVQAIMRAVTLGFPLRLPPQIRHWLDSGCSPFERQQNHE
jgi:hypothetical protein